MIIAVDFDGTIVEHKYPEIGREIPFAIETLKMLIEGTSSFYGVCARENYWKRPLIGVKNEVLSFMR